MLLILAMDPLQRLLQRAAKRGILSPIWHMSDRIKISLYADDATIFVKPTKQDLGTLKEILRHVWSSLWLAHQFEKKTEIFPICCNDQHLEDILDVFPARSGFFPCQYLGLPCI
jgi:hypothetical protein